jgi:peptide deformylase
MKYKIVTIKKKEDEKFLREKTRKIKDEKDPKIKQLIKNMREIMIKEKGVGLSANQIGLDKQIFVMGFGEDFFAFINPKIIKHSREMVDMEEGCLSIPGIAGIVSRPVAIEIRGFNEKGEKVKMIFDGVFARICQHEYDHLQGILFIDRANKIYKTDRNVE